MNSAHSKVNAWVTVCAAVLLDSVLLGRFKMIEHLVRVPETDSATKWQLSHQQIVHPPKSKLQVLHFIPLKMIVNVLWRQTTDRTGA